MLMEPPPLDLIEASWIQKPRVQLMAVQQKLSYALSGGPERAHCLCRSSDSGSWSGTAALYRPTLYTQTFWLSKAPPTFSLRKEVIQPQVLLRLPCYDFTPIMNHTLGLFD